MQRNLPSNFNSTEAHPLSELSEYGAVCCRNGGCALVLLAHDCNDIGNDGWNGERERERER